MRDKQNDINNTHKILKYDGSIIHGVGLVAYFFGDLNKIIMESVVQYEKKELNWESVECSVRAILNKR